MFNMFLNNHLRMTGAQVWISLLAIGASVFLPFSTFVGTAQATSAPVLSIGAWKNGQTHVLVTFDQPVSETANSPLIASDFTVGGNSGLTISSVLGFMGNQNYVLTFSSSLNSSSTLTLGCGTNVIFNHDPTPVACTSSGVNVFGGPADTVAPNIIGVGLNSSNQFVVNANEPLLSSSINTSEFTLSTAATDTETITSATGFGNGVMVNASGANAAFNDSVMVGAGITDVVGNALNLTGGDTFTFLPSVKISEVHIGSSTNSKDEFVELYNVGNMPVSLTGLHLHIVTPGVSPTDTDMTLTKFATSIPSHGFYLIASTGYSGSVGADATYGTVTSSLVADGAVYVSNSATTGTGVIDKVGWGASTVKEGTAASDPGAGSIERKASMSSTVATMASGGTDVQKGNSQDTENNAQDFVVQSSTNSQNTSSATEFAFGFGNNVDTTPPTVTGSFPSNSSVVPQNLQTVGISMSEALNGTTVTTSTVKVTSSSAPGTNLCSTVSYNPGVTNGMNISCTIADSAHPMTATSYTLTVVGGTSGVKDVSGNALASDYMVTFTTSGGISFTNTMPPSIVGGYPMQGTSVPSNTSALTLNFNQSLDTSTLVSSNFTLTDTTSSTVISTLTFSPQTVVNNNDAVQIVIGTALSGGHSYTLTAGVGVKSSAGIALPSAYSLMFNASNTTDSTAPVVISKLPASGATGVNVSSPIEIAFDDALDPMTVNQTNVHLLEGTDVVPSTINYSAGDRTIKIFPSNVLDPSTTFTINLSTSIKNMSGIALASTNSWTFATGTADVIAPTVALAQATQSSVFVTFSEAMIQSQVENLSNYTITKNGSPVTLTALSGGSAKYNPDMKMVTISGAPLSSGNTFTVTVAGVHDLSGNAIDTSNGNNGSGGTVQDQSTQTNIGTGSFQGNTFDNPQGFGSSSGFGFVPQPMAMPFNATAGATSGFHVNIPITKQVQKSANSGSIVLTFPTGFDASGVAKDSNSPMNSDANGPAPGTIGFSVTGSGQTVTITLSSVASRCGTGNTDSCGSSTAQQDNLNFDLTGIVNTTIPRGYGTNGYTVGITTKTGSTVLESLTSVPFFINQAGSSSLAVTVGTASATSGAIGVHIMNPGTGQQDKTATFSSSSSQTVTFTGLNDGMYMLWTDQVGTSSLGTNYLGNPNPVQVQVSGSTTKNITLSSTTGLATLTVNLNATGVTGKDVDVFISGPGGFQAKEITSTSASNTVTFKLASGDYSVGVGPHVNMGSTFVMPTPPDYAMPAPVPLSVSGTTISETSGTANDGTVALTITSAANSLNLSVVDATGASIANAMIDIHSVLNNYGTFAQTGISGTATAHVPSGTYQVHAFLFGTPGSQDKQITVDDSGNVYVDGSTTPSTTVTLKISKSSIAISGTVTDGTNPVQGASVFAVCTSGCFGNNNVPDMTGSDGTFSLYVSSGTWQVSAFIPGYGKITGSTYTITNTSQTGVVLSPSSTTYRTISGVVTVNGTGQANVNIMATNGTNTNNTVTDASGNYSLKVPSGTGYSVKAFGAVNYPDKTNVDLSSSNQTEDFTISGSLNTVTITAKNSGGSATTVSDLFINFVNTTNGTSTNGSISNASSTIVSLPAGSYRMDVHSSSAAMAPSDISSDNGSGTVVASGVLTVDGAEAIKVTMPSLSVLSGSVKDDSAAAIKKAWVELSQNSTHFRTGTQTDSSGNYSISVPDGVYNLQVFEPKHVFTQATVTVSGATTKNITGTTPTETISGTVKVGSNGIANAAVRATRSSGGEISSKTDVDGTYSLPAYDGTWTVTAVGFGYAPASATSILSGSSQSNVNITLTTPVTLPNAGQGTVVPSSGGAYHDANSKLDVSFDPGALGSTSSQVTIMSTPRNDVQGTSTTSLIGNALDLTATDTGGKDVTWSGNADVQLKKTVSELQTAGLTTWAQVKALTLSYQDSTGAWVAVSSATVVPYDSSDVVVSSPASDLSNVSYVIFSATVNHFTVFAVTASKDSLSPATPSGLSANSASNGIALTWTAVTTNSDSTPIADLLGYELYRSTSSGGTYTQINTSDIAGTSYTDTTVADNTQYYYKITAADTGGNESTKSSAVAGTKVVSGGGTGGGGSGNYVLPSITTITTPAVPAVKATPATHAVPATPAVPAVVVKRDLAKEKSAVSDFAKKFKKLPKSKADWKWVSDKAYGKTIAATPAVPAVPAVKATPAVPAKPATPKSETAVAPTTWSSFTRDLSVGSNGADVSQLQEYLGVKKTGTFDATTKRAVQNYQKAHDLTPRNGRVGPATRAALNSLAP